MKVQAFTIWELLISIVMLSSIVSLVYTGYLKSEKHMDNEQNKLMDLNSLIRIEKSLSDMFDEANIIFTDGDYLVFSYRDFNKYISLEDSLMIVWDENSEILFSIPINNLNYEFLNKKDDYIKGIKIHLGQRHFGSIITLKKTYSNQFQVNNL